jgi:hypothetical protein
MRRAAVIVVVGGMSLLAAAAQAALLARIVNWVALDQPTLSQLVLAWGQRWALLLACCMAACLVLRTPSGRFRVLRDALLLGRICTAGLALSLLAGGLAGAMQQLGITATFSGLPHPARQAAAEAMLTAAEWSGPPLAAALAVVLLRPWRAGSARQVSAARDPRTPPHP